MREVTYIDDQELIKLEFDSLWELIDYLKNHRYNLDFSGRDSEEGSFQFTGTHSYGEAENLCLYGGSKSEFEKFIHLKETLDSSLEEKRLRNVQYNDFIGEVPNVPLYLMGYPLNMIRQEKEEIIEDKVIDIYYNVAAAAYNRKEQMFNRGVIALSLIDYLESMGYKVNLCLFELSFEPYSKQIVYYKFNLKTIDEQSDYRTLFFPLTHPSFLRRILFKLLEKTDGLRPSWSTGYGRPADLSLIKKIIPNANGRQFIFYDPQSMGIYGENLEEDFRRCVGDLKVEEVIKENKNKR